MTLAIDTSTWLAPLRATELFADCTDSELEEIDCLMTEVSVPVGARLVQEGSPGQEFFVIREGAARVSKQGETVKELRAGDFFGELALLDRTLRRASVTATTNMRLWVLNRPDFGELLWRAPTVDSAVRSEAARRRSRLNHPSMR